MVHFLLSPAYAAHGFPLYWGAADLLVDAVERNRELNDLISENHPTN
jgi:hypothetical protein